MTKKTGFLDLIEEQYREVARREDSDATTKWVRETVYNSWKAGKKAGQKADKPKAQDEKPETKTVRLKTTNLGQVVAQHDEKLANALDRMS